MLLPAFAGPICKDHEGTEKTLKTEEKTSMPTENSLIIHIATKIV